MNYINNKDFNLLNSKSILNCESEKDLKFHQDEIGEIFSKLSNLTKGALIKIIPIDPLYKEISSVWFDSSDNYNYDEVLSGLDCKNGCDFMIYNDKVCAIVYGQNYTFNTTGEMYMIENLVEFNFLKDGKYEKLIEESVDFDSKDKLLEYYTNIYESGEYFIDQTDIINKISFLDNREFVMKKDPLDVQIRFSEKEKKVNKSVLIDKNIDIKER